MIRHVFLFGVVLPTIITIVFFVGFLICWFKFSAQRWRIWNKRKSRVKNPFSAHEINSTQKIVQYGQEEEEMDNEKNTEVDKCTDDSDRDPGGSSGMNSTGGTSGGRTVNKYVITPSQVEYHYQENLRLSSSGCDNDQSECSCGKPPVSDNQKPRGDGLSSDNRGVENNGMCMSPSLEQLHQVEDNGELKLYQQGELLVQHTFHFPNLSSHGGEQEGRLGAEHRCHPRVGRPLVVGDEEESHFYGDSEEDSDTENYGHFVPLSEVVLQNEKKKQFYKMYGGCGEKDGCHGQPGTDADLGDVNEHLTPLQV